MKKIFFILFTSLHLIAIGQIIDIEETEVPNVEEQEIDDPVFTVVEKLPIAPGCEHLQEAEGVDIQTCFNEYIIAHISENFKYPKIAKEQELQGNIYVEFVVEPNLNVSQVRLARGIANDYKEGTEEQKLAAKQLEIEAIRVIQSLEFVAPATQRGKEVSIRYIVPISAKVR